MGYVEELRRLVGHQRILLPGVRAIIRNSEGQVLLQQRGDFGTWGLPAGSVELDETVLETLQREVWEETGLHVLGARPFGIFSDPHYNVTTYPTGDQVQSVTFAFVVDAWTGELSADGQETLRLAFFDLDGLPAAEHLHPPHYNTLLRYRQFLTTGQLIVD